jgi:hypothetical protein
VLLFNRHLTTDAQQAKPLECCYPDENQRSFGADSDEQADDWYTEYEIPDDLIW